LVIVGLLWASM
jgi:hypothetical protein